MGISEPMTMATDYLIFGFCLFFGCRLWRLQRLRDSVALQLWSLGFLAAGFSALAGGSFHGFACRLNSIQLTFLWNLTVFLIGLTAGWMMAGFLAAFPPRTHRSAPWLLLGVAVTVFGLSLLALGVEVHRLFNRNDLYHIIHLAAFYLLYRGASLLEDRPVLRRRQGGC